MTLPLLPLPRTIIEEGGAVVLADEPSTWLDPTMPPQGYRLTVDATGATVVGADEAGRAYGLSTLEQLRRVRTDGRVPTVEIHDFPDFLVRGVMLDVSRDKVPSMATLKHLISRLASWKINHLELYIEHTFAYSGHDDVWAGASPFSAAEITELDVHCRSLHVELSANQNCLGHMERWLQHDRYRPLAISPDGWTDARGRHRAPTTLEPGNPNSLALVRDMLGQLVPLFSSSRVNVGLDEPWELPDERHSDYLAYIAALRAAPELAGKEMVMWGDIVAHHPEQVVEVPAGVTIAEWGYEADHPYVERTRVLAEAGLPHWVCPGTSSWNTLVGRTTNMRANITAAAAAGRDSRAAGILVTDWGDNGHLQFLPVSEPGFAWAAAAGWCEASSRRLDFASVLALHVFEDPTARLGQALLDLGDAHRLVVPQIPNNSILAAPLYYPNIRMGDGLTAGMADGDLAAAADAVASGAELARRSASARSDAELIVEELSTSAELLAICITDARHRLAGDGPATHMAAAVADVAVRQRELWLQRNRPGGLDDSLARLTRYQRVLERA